MPEPVAEVAEGAHIGEATLLRAARLHPGAELGFDVEPTEVAGADALHFGDEEQLPERAGVALVGRAEVDSGDVARGVVHHVRRGRGRLGGLAPLTAGEGEDEVDREAPIGEFVAELGRHPMPVGRELTLEPVERSRRGIGGGACRKDGHDMGATKATTESSRARTIGAAKESHVGFSLSVAPAQRDRSCEVAWRATAKPRALVPQTTAVIVSRCTLGRAFRLPTRRTSRATAAGQCRTSTGFPRPREICCHSAKPSESNLASDRSRSSQ